MTQHHGTVQPQQAFRLRGARGRLRDLELLGGAPQNRRIADRLSRGQEQQRLRVPWQELEPLPETFLDLSLKRQRARQTEAAGELRRREPSRQFEQSKRIPLCLGHQLCSNSFVQTSRNNGSQQVARVGVGEPLEWQLRQACGYLPASSRREEHHHRLRQKSS